MIAVMMLASTSVFAEQGDMWFGVNANYALHKDYKNFGVGARLQWEFIDNLRAEPFFNYYFKKDYLSFWEAGINVQYLLNLGQSGFNLYPLAGIGVLGAKYSTPSFKGSVGNVSWDVEGVSTSNEKIDANFGLGIEYPIANGFKVFAEGKYRIRKNFNCPVISAGVAIGF